MIIVYTSVAEALFPDPGPKVIRPCPLVSISSSSLKNKMANLGSTYTITLNGTILADQGSPLLNAVYSPTQIAEFSEQYNPKPTGHQVEAQDVIGSIIKKQHVLRSLFAVEGRRVEILPVRGNEPALVFYPRLESIDFEEGLWTDYCRYTIVLSADLLFDHEENIIMDSMAYLNFEPSGQFYDLLYTNQHTSVIHTKKQSLIQFNQNHGGFVEDFSENWTLEPEDGNGNTVNPFMFPGENIIRSYRLTRNVSATGRTIYGPGENGQDSIRYEAWEQAKNFISKKIIQDKDGNAANNSVNTYDQYPKLNFETAFAGKFLNLSQQAFGGYNHARTESIDKTNGVYTLTDTWLLSSGTSYENYSVSLAKNNTNSIVTVTIDGTIKGLSSLPGSGSIYGGNADVVTYKYNTPYENAILKYRQISNSGTFDMVSHAHKRASNTIGKFLNDVPVSVSVGSNEFTGEITYNVVYDTRPLNYIPGSISENITIQDTYPGDVFVSIPVLGRKTGPVLQYLGTRTEYQRTVNIELIVDTIYGGTAREQLLLAKPSLNEPTRTTLNNLIAQLSPAREPNIRKYFLNPPNESWDPKEKRYSINLNWIYELND